MDGMSSVLHGQSIVGKEARKLIVVSIDKGNIRIWTGIRKQAVETWRDLDRPFGEIAEWIELRRDGGVTRRVGCVEWHLSHAGDGGG